MLNTHAGSRPHGVEELHLCGCSRMAGPGLLSSQEKAVSAALYFVIVFRVKT